MGSGGLERRIVSVLFCDLVDFTPLSERLDPEDIVIVQDRYFGAVREAVARYGGEVGKFIGDAVMAVFGTPRAREDDAERAVRAALVILGAIDTVAAALDLEPGTLKLRVGVNTGEVATDPAQVGAEMLVTGDTVNVAARLQTAAPVGGILVGEATALAVAEAMVLEDMGGLTLKGKGEPVRAHRVIGPRAQPSRDEAMGSLRAPLLGREADLSALAALLDAPSPAAMTIVAPPGVGKSRLVQEFVRDSGRRALSTRCRADASGPFDPVGDLVRSALGGGDAVALRAALRDRGLPAAQVDVVVDESMSLLSPSAGDDSRRPEERAARFDAWITAVETLAGPQAVWVVEDLHRAGDDLLAFLEHALAVVGAPVCLFTARPGALDHPAMQAVVARAPVRELSTLTLNDSATLIRALVGDAIPDDVVALIAERSDGTPLFIEELMRAWASAGVLQRSNGSWTCTLAFDAIPLPSTVQAIYAAQLEDLPGAAREAARRASIAGRRFPSEALADLGVEDAAEGIGVLVRRGIVTGPDEDPVLGTTFTFRHALVRDAAYASLSRRDKAALHVSLARWLGKVSLHPDAVAEPVAVHLDTALEVAPELAQTVGDVARDELVLLAADGSERAAAAAERASAVEAASRHYRRAIELTPASDRLALIRRHAALGRHLAATGNLDDARTLLEAAWELLADFDLGVEGAVEVFGLTATALCSLHFTAITFERSRDVAREALARLAGRHELTEAILTCDLEWAIEGLTNRQEDLNAAADRLREVARAHGDRGAELLALKRITPVDHRAVAELAEEVGDWSVVASSLQIAAWDDFDAGSDPGPTLARGRELALAHGLTEARGWLDYQAAEFAFAAGEWDGAVELAGEIVDRAEAFGHTRLIYRTALVWAPIAVARDDSETLERLRAWMDRARAALPDPPSPYGLCTTAALDLQLDTGVALPDDERLARALALFSRAPSWAATSAVLVEDMLRRGNLEAARIAVDSVREVAARAHERDALRGLGSLLGARLSVVAGDGDPEPEARAALRVFRDVQAPWWIVRALELLGDIGRASPDEMSEASSIREQLGLAPSARPTVDAGER